MRRLLHTLFGHCRWQEFPLPPFYTGSYRDRFFACWCGESYIERMSYSKASHAEDA